MIGDGLKAQQDTLNIPTMNGYSGEEALRMAFYVTRLNKARDQRIITRDIFDGLSYDADYQLNLQARNSYLRPKKNDSEVRVSTGIVEKKIETVVNELLSYNFQPEIRVFDEQDNQLKELGQDLTDLVTRTNQIEEDDDMWQDAIIELMTQRAVFVEETMDKRTFNTATQEYARKRLLKGLRVFLGDISIPAYEFNRQPYLVIYTRMTYVEAKTIYGHLKNFDKVKPKNPVATDYTLPSYNYRFNLGLGIDECEILTYISYPDDEYQLIINGVMQYDDKKSYKETLGDFRGYHISMANLKALDADFAYGRPLTASAKLLAGLSQETLRNLIRKWRMNLEPPMGIKVGTDGSGKVYTRDIWTEGALAVGIGKDDFSVLNPYNQGITNGDMQMMKLIEEKTTEFMGVPSLMQGTEGQKLTATQTREQMKQAIKQLGLAIYGVMRMKRDMTMLRLLNVLNNYTKPITKKALKIDDKTTKIVDLYRQFTVSNTILDENGMKGDKKIMFTENGLQPEEEEEIYRFEEEQANNGKNIRIRALNSTVLQNLNLLFYVTVSPKERDSSDLDKVTFTDMLGQAANIAQIAQRPLNGDKVVEQFEITWGVKDWFQDMQPQMQIDPITGQPIQGGQGNPMDAMMADLDNMGGQSGPGAQMQAGMQPQKTSINTMTK